MFSRVPLGVGIEREVVAVCRHLVRDGTRLVNLVTDESMISGEKLAAKSGVGERLKVDHAPSPHAHIDLWFSATLSVIVALLMILHTLPVIGGS